MKFEIGDVVKLKSGGPEMTVAQYPFKTMEGVEYPDKVKCEWFNEEYHLKNDVFHIEEVEKL
ncbi:MAG: YodC family protein [Alistipes sp.]|nr:YodC family protein [Alistipes sp.]